MLVNANKIGLLYDGHFMRLFSGPVVSEVFWLGAMLLLNLVVVFTPITTVHMCDIMNTTVENCLDWLLVGYNAIQFITLKWQSSRS